MGLKLHFFGRIALEKGFLQAGELEEAMILQRDIRRMGHWERLGNICIKLGYLTPEQVDEIIEIQQQTQRAPAQLYGNIALQNQLITTDQLAECLQLQKEDPEYAPIGYYLLKKNYLDLKGHQYILKAITRLQNQMFCQKYSGANPQDERYGMMALEHGLITLEQLESFFQTEERKESLCQYFLSKKYLSADQHDFLLQTLERRGKSDFLPSPSTTEEKPADKGECLKILERQSSEEKSLPSSLAYLIPGFQLTEKLGEGGMAIVYKGLQERDGSSVAIKILPPKNQAWRVLDPEAFQDESQARRFKREGHLLKKFNHPQIIKVLEVGSHQGYLYYVMEYLQGQTLAQMLENTSRGSLEEKWALEIFWQVAGALVFLWEQNILHRDIKLENVFITRQGKVKLFDFGIAKNLMAPSKDQDTQANIVMGTPLYMAPELTKLKKGMKVDSRSDIYALGVALYIMLTGQPPYYDESMLSLLVKHCESPIPLACSHNDGVSLSTSQLIQRMLAKNPEDRFQTPEEFIQAIDQNNRALEEKVG